MASITELLDKLKNARATVELVEACGKRVCSSEEHWNCPYGNEGMIDCAVLLEAAYEDTIENLLQLAEAIPAADVASVVRWIPVTERLRGMPHNVKFLGVDFVGPILIAGVSDEDFTDLPPESMGFLLDGLRKASKEDGT